MGANKRKNKLAVVTWLWGSNEKFRIKHVEKLYENFKKNYDLPFNFYCITDKEYEFSKNIIPVKMPPVFCSVYEKKCYRRLSLFNPKYGLKFGKRILQLDLDLAIVGNLTEMLSTQEPLKIWEARSRGLIKKVKNPTFMLFDVQIMENFYNEFIKNEKAMIKKARQKYRGSDQALFSEFFDCAIWTRADGICGFRDDKITKAHTLPDDIKIISFHGQATFDKYCHYAWINKYWN